MKRYLKDSERVYTTGAFLIWDLENKKWLFDGFEDDTFFDGELINSDENGLPYVEETE